MIEDSGKKTFQGILVYQLDRFARNRYDSAVYKKKLKKNGVRVLSARENISQDASGILIESVLEGMAEYYSAELSQKIRRGLDINASKCLCTGGGVALGFKVDKDRHFQVDEDTAPVVREIFEMYANTIYFGSGCYGIEEAAEGYFGKTADQLTDAEAIVLAGLPNAPSAYASSPELALKRTQTVLKRMVKCRALTQSEADAIAAEARQLKILTAG